jgi:hypothetical protein
LSPPFGADAPRVRENPPGRPPPTMVDGREGVRQPRDPHGNPSCQGPGHPERP